MYKEEFGVAEMDSNSSSDNATKLLREEFHSTDAQDDQPSSAGERCPPAKQSSHEPNPNLTTETSLACTDPGFHMELQDHRQQNSASISLLHDAIRRADGSSRFVAYPMAELARYANGVSLTLGLQHCDGDLRDSEGHEGFLPVRGEDLYNGGPLLGFGSSNLLHDYVA